MEEDIHESNIAFVDFFKALKDVDESCCGGILDENYKEVLSNFRLKVSVVHVNFGMSITPKIHIICDHFEQYFDETGRALIKTTNQHIENAHAYVRKKWNFPVIM